MVFPVRLLVSVHSSGGSKYSRLDKDLHTTSESQDKVKGGFLLDICRVSWLYKRRREKRLTVIRKSPSVLELLSSKDQSLLIGRNALFVLNLGLDIVNRVRGFNL